MPVVRENIHDPLAAHGLHRDAIGQAVALVRTSLVKVKPVEKPLTALRDDAYARRREDASDGSSRIYSQRFSAEQKARTSVSTSSVVKTTHLEMRPIYVRTEEHTRGHVLVVMLAYLIRRELSRAWAALNITVEEGLAQLATLCSMEVKTEGGASCLRIPVPRDASSALLKAASVRVPAALPPLADSCSHAPVAAIKTKTTCTNSDLGRGSDRWQG